MILSSHRRFVAALLVVFALFASACGDDGDSPSPTSDDPGGGEGDFDDLIVPETSDDDDVTNQMLARIFGLPPTFVPDSMRGCLNDALLQVFPDGVVPEDVAVTEDLVNGINEAASACGFDDL